MTMVTRNIPAGNFKAHCLQLLDDVQQTRGEIVLTKHGKPVARLVPTDAPAPDLFGRMRGSVTISGDTIAASGEIWDAEL